MLVRPVGAEVDIDVEDGTRSLGIANRRLQRTAVDVRIIALVVHIVEQACEVARDIIGIAVNAEGLVVGNPGALG